MRSEPGMIEFGAVIVFVYSSLSTLVSQNRHPVAPCPWWASAAAAATAASSSLLPKLPLGAVGAGTGVGYGVAHMRWCRTPSRLPPRCLLHAARSLSLGQGWGRAVLYATDGCGRTFMTGPIECSSRLRYTIRRCPMPIILFAGASAPSCYWPNGGGPSESNDILTPDSPGPSNDMRMPSSSTPWRSSRALFAVLDANAPPALLPHGSRGISVRFRRVSIGDPGDGGIDVGNIGGL